MSLFIYSSFICAWDCALFTLAEASADVCATFAAPAAPAAWFNTSAVRRFLQHLSRYCVESAWATS